MWYLQLYQSCSQTKMTLINYTNYIPFLTPLPLSILNPANPLVPPPVRAHSLPLPYHPLLHHALCFPPKLRPWSRCPPLRHPTTSNPNALPPHHDPSPFLFVVPRENLEMDNVSCLYSRTSTGRHKHIKWQFFMFFWDGGNSIT